MPRIIVIVLILLNAFLYGCRGDAHRYQYAGHVSFRKSYAGHENWPDAYLDSVEKSNPEYMPSADSAADKVLAILDSLQIGNKEALFLNKISEDMTDTITMTSEGPGMDTIYVQNDIDMMQAKTWSSLRVKNGRLLDSIPLKGGLLTNDYRFIRLKNKTFPFVLFISQYYIMNGWNYEVSVYERKGVKNIR